MKSLVFKRSIIIAGHKTSVSLEDAFWNELKQIASRCDRTLSEMVATIDTERAHRNLSSAIRLFVLDHYRNTRGRRTPADDHGGNDRIDHARNQGVVGETARLTKRITCSSK
jgi:predicted DNA-binding ribbon-helix-helix protein